MIATSCAAIAACGVRHATRTTYAYGPLEGRRATIASVTEAFVAEGLTPRVDPVAGTVAADSLHRCRGDAAAPRFEARAYREGWVELLLVSPVGSSCVREDRIVDRWLAQSYERLALRLGARPLRVEDPSAPPLDASAWRSSRRAPSSFVNPELRSELATEALGAGLMALLGGYGAAVGAREMGRGAYRESDLWYIPLAGPIAAMAEQRCGAPPPPPPPRDRWSDLERLRGFPTPSSCDGSVVLGVFSLAFQLVGAVLIAVSPGLARRVRSRGPFDVPLRLSIDVGPTGGGVTVAF